VHGGVEVLAGDELETSRSERASVGAESRGPLSGEKLAAVDRVRRDGLEQHVPAAHVQGSGQGIQDVDRSNGLGSSAVLLQAAPRVEGDRP
jgi:hypothetical protein